MKEEHKFVRSQTNKGAVLNTDRNALQAYKLQKMKQKKLDNKLNEIDNIKSEMKEIKQMLNILIERLK